MNNTINPYNHYLLTMFARDTEYTIAVYHDKDTANKVCEQLNTKYDYNGVMFEVTPVPDFNSINFIYKAVDIKLKNIR